MQSFRQTIILLILLLVNSCAYRPYPNHEFITTINSVPQPNNPIKYLNGVYTMTSYEQDQIIDSMLNSFPGGFIDPIVFYGNGIYTQIGRLNGYSKIEFEGFLNNKNDFLNNTVWGVYTYKDSIIYAQKHSVFMGRGGNISSWHLCHYVGIVRGRQIVDWHLVEPYPALNKLEQGFKFNQKILKHLKSYRDFTYQEFPKKMEIDSNAVWIMKYKQ
jgi:hypothetical protein